MPNYSCEIEVIEAKSSRDTIYRIASPKEDLVLCLWNVNIS